VGNAAASRAIPTRPGTAKPPRGYTTGSNARRLKPPQPAPRRHDAGQIKQDQQMELRCRKQQLWYHRRQFDSNRRFMVRKYKAKKGLELKRGMSHSGDNHSSKPLVHKKQK
jgi:hypothetical protein